MTVYVILAAEKGIQPMPEYDCERLTRYPAVDNYRNTRKFGC